VLALEVVQAKAALAVSYESSGIKMPG